MREGCENDPCALPVLEKLHKQRRKAAVKYRQALQGGRMLCSLSGGKTQTAQAGEAVLQMR